MRNILTIVGLGGLLFGLSAGGSWYLLQEQQVQQQMVQEELERQAAETTAASWWRTPAVSPLEMQPMASDEPAETIARVSQSLRAREERIREQERQMEHKGERLQHVLADLQHEQHLLTALQEQVESRVEEAKGLMQSIEAQQASLKKESDRASRELAATQQAQHERNDQEMRNIRDVSEWLKPMPPETAAEYLRTMVNDGKMDLVVQLLRNIEERNVSRILVEMDDASLVSELIERVKQAPPNRPAGNNR